MEDHGRKLSCRAENPMLPNSVKMDEKILEIFCKFYFVLCSLLTTNFLCGVDINSPQSFWDWSWHSWAPLPLKTIAGRKLLSLVRLWFHLRNRVSKFPKVPAACIYCLLIDSSSVRRIPDLISKWIKELWTAVQTKRPGRHEKSNQRTSDPHKLTLPRHWPIYVLFQILLLYL